jgi:hypothetical protein
MRTPIHCSNIIAILASLPVLAQEPASQADHVIFQQGDGEVVIKIDDKPIATYVYEDSEIPRPYFAHVKTLEGVQVTRNHPPLPGKDKRDHPTMHPGIWMAFGDLDGSDFWRNKAKVKHVRVVHEPVADAASGRFVEEKHYLRPDGSLICREEFRFSIHLRPGTLPGPSGYLLVWDSTFSSDNEFFFGDQEEMGLGLRVATPMSEVKGGELSDSTGRNGAKEIWSHSARWCDYSGVIGDQKVGMTLMCHPENFRESWMHARDYGFVAANPFGRDAMKKGKPSKVKVKPNETLRLRYAIFVHSGDIGGNSTIEPCYEEYLKLTHQENE